MSLLMGPVLSFRGYDVAAARWNLTALVVTDTAPGNLSVTGQSTPVKAEALWKVGNRTAYRYTFSLPVTAPTSAKNSNKTPIKTSTTATYKVLGKSYDVAVPVAGFAPTMAYASCNGFSSLKLIKSLKDKEPNALWKKMAARHQAMPYHLLLLGGDQVYADEMWEIDGQMKDWMDKSWADGNDAAATPTMRKWLDKFFFGLYTDRWAQPEVADMLARIPTVAMWDDHDLMDGWGSYPVERQTCPVFGAIWNSASKAFAVFQQQLEDGALRPGAIGTTRPGKKLPITKGAFSYGYIVGSIAILAVDMRSQRNVQDQVVGTEHWNEIYAWIDALPVGVVHLIVMSSIPVIYPGFDTIETLLGLFPGHQDLEDDLRDHWNSPPHREERLRLIQRLLKIPETVRPLIVSGDVHIAALGAVESTRPQTKQPVINQLISSGIVHPGPGAVVLLALRNLFDSDQEVERGVVARMMKFPNSATKFIGNRNFLSLEPDTDRLRPRIWANWQVEGEEFELTKVIEPNPIGSA